MKLTNRSTIRHPSGTLYCATVDGTRYRVSMPLAPGPLTLYYHADGDWHPCYQTDSNGNPQHSEYSHNIIEKILR